MKSVFVRAAVGLLAVTTASVVIASSGADAAPPHRAGASLSATAVASLQQQVRSGSLEQSHGTVGLCVKHKVRCKVLAVTKSRTSSEPLASTTPLGYGASELQKAYGLKSAGSRNGTIVVIGAGAYPTLESDLNIYRSTYKLPACTTANGCFTQINYLGGKPYQPTTDSDDQWGEEEIAVETALDADMASAACPKCKIVSMQVPLQDGFFGTTKQTHDAILHFATGVQTARKLGASAVSISYGYPTDHYSDTGKITQLMSQKGMAVVSSSGDDGFMDETGQWPQSLTTVTSAGGTSLFTAKNSRGYSETAWNGAGSGCTPDLPAANGQPAAVAKACAGKRAASDISAVADPYTGVAVYDSYAPGSGIPSGFMIIGGTSASSPFLAGLYARAPQNNAVLGPNTVYAAAPSAFHDVTVGANAAPGTCESEYRDAKLCNSGPGWDGPTGVGSPIGLKPFSG